MKKQLLLLLFAVFLLTAVSVCAETINVGTYAGYRPFVYYDYNNDLTGLDIDLLKEIGKRKDFTLKFYDMAFDGLIDSVSVGQVDLIAGGFSVTPEREKEIIYSQSYYSNQAIIIASINSNVQDNLVLNDVLSYRFGVQRGSSYDQWLKTNLVGEGLLSTQNIFTFSSMDSAAKALQNGNVDLVMMDTDTYKHTYQKSGNFKIVNDDNPDDYQIIPWVLVGSQTDDAQAFGSALTYANRYFFLKFFNIATPDADPDEWKRKKSEAANAEEAAAVAAMIKQIEALLNSGVTEQNKTEISAVIKKHLKVDGKPSANYLKIQKLEDAQAVYTAVKAYLTDGQGKQ